MAATTLNSFETESTLTTFEVKTMTEIVEEVEEVAPVLEMRNKAPKMLAVEESIRRLSSDRVVDLIYWKDASSLLLLIALSFLSVLTVVSYISLTGAHQVEVLEFMDWSDSVYDLLPCKKRTSFPSRNLDRNSAHQVEVLEFMDWSDSVYDEAVEKDTVPPDGASFKTFVEEVVKRQSPFPDKKLLVHCLDGIEKSGLFLCAFLLPWSVLTARDADPRFASGTKQFQFLCNLETVL